MKNESYFYKSTLQNTKSNEFQSYLFSFFKEIFVNIIEVVATSDEASLNNKTYIAEFISYGVVV